MQCQINTSAVYVSSSSCFAVSSVLQCHFGPAIPNLSLRCHHWVSHSVHPIIKLSVTLHNCKQFVLPELLPANKYSHDSISGRDNASHPLHKSLDKLKSSFRNRTIHPAASRNGSGNHFYLLPSHFMTHTQKNTYIIYCAFNYYHCK